MPSNKDSKLKSVAKVLFLVWLFFVLFTVFFVTVAYPLKFAFQLALNPLGVSPSILTWTSGAVGVVCAVGGAFFLCRKIWRAWAKEPNDSNNS